ncbi:hypothetical protein FRB94_010790 [Tulasnella sp. JGI-2019a]|nr:hypothetical protein FRB93_013896 [Tulasnella sp. JGI-2019a]KAG9010262.1 hypothetical protein FRB94_010790 [Tulasnella sp. JGI-2019a]KAG9035893.1 hypothetical protein FRB95_010296 [Tulasnella sp. JGI-2019a]
MSNAITTEDVRTWFRGLENAQDTLKVMQQYVDENVVWTISTSADGPLGKTTPISGTYDSREAFVKGAMAPLLPLFTDGIHLSLTDVIVQPSENNDPSDRHLTKAVVEMKGTATMKSGKDWNNDYAWVIYFNNETKKAVRVKTYFDSAAVNKAFEQ